VAQNISRAAIARAFCAWTTKRDRLAAFDPNSTMPTCARCGNDFSGNGNLCPSCYAKAVATVTTARPQPQFRKQTDSYLRSAPVTSALIAINIIIFVAMVASSRSIDFSIETLVKWGGSAGILVRQGEWWRLFTSMFLHANPIHIGFNMLCLFQLGFLAERAFGKIPYLLAYIATGICASLTSNFIHPKTLGVGASGAIFGIAGFLLTPIALKKLIIYTTGKSSILRTLVMFAIYNLAIGAAIPVIDNSAHVGGLVSGLVIGLFFCNRTRTLGSPPGQTGTPVITVDHTSIESRSTREIGR